MEIMVVRYGIHNESPDRKVHGANMGPIWDRQDPGGPHVDQWTLLYGMILKYFRGIIALHHNMD